MSAGLASLLLALAAPSEKLLPKSADLGGPKVLVVGIGLDAKARSHVGFLEHVGQAQVLAAGRFTLLKPSDAFNPKAARQRSEAANEAAKLIAEGEKALDDLDSQKALRLFSEALSELKASDWGLNGAQLVRAWVLKAGALATNGDAAQARQEIEKIIAIAPQATFPDAYFSPELLKLAEAQRKSAQTAKGELTVRTEPSGAEVFVDGRFAGYSPVTVNGLTSAKHLVSVSAGGCALLQDELVPTEELLKLEPAELSVVYKRNLERVVQEPTGSDRDAAMQELARATGADQVLLLLARKSVTGERLDVTALRLDARDGHNFAYRTAHLPLGEDDTWAAWVGSLLEKDARRDGKNPVTHFTGGSGSVRTTAGVALLGAGVAAVVAGVFFGTQASAKAAEFQRTPQVQTQVSGNLASSGRAFSVLADVSLIAGAASAVTGGILLFTGRSRGAAAEPSAGEAKTDVGPSSDLRIDERRRIDERPKVDDTRRDDARRDEQKKRDEDRKRDDDEKKRREDEAARAEEQRREAQKKEEPKREEEKRPKKGDKRAEEKRREEERLKEEEKKKEEKRREEERKRLEQKAREEDARKKEDEKKKKETEDDLRNY